MEVFVGNGGGGGSGSGSAVAPSLSSGMSESVSANVTTSATQMLRDFSLEVYDKKELQFLGGSVNSDTPSSKP